MRDLPLHEQPNILCDTALGQHAAQFAVYLGVPNADVRQCGGRDVHQKQPHYGNVAGSLEEASGGKLRIRIRGHLDSRHVVPETPGQGGMSYGAIHQVAVGIRHFQRW